MRFSQHVLLLLVAVASLDHRMVAARKPSRSSARASSSSRSSRPQVSKRRYEEEEDDFALPEDSSVEQDEEFEEEYDDEDYVPSRRPPPASRRGRPPPRKPSKQPRSRYEEDRPRRPVRSSSRRGPPPSRRSSRGRVVPYGRGPPEPSTFARGLSAIRSSMPDPSSVREAAANSLGAAREATSSLSANLYREVKGLTSSELEQVMLKATRPDDTAVKGKHVERLVGITYQISARFDLYDAVLRKLWAKMAEKDWRTSIKALYILHRFSADGAPEHAAALKARLRELRRTKDPKRKLKYFNSKQLLAGDNRPENRPFQAFMSRYAHYVLLRAQCFGGMFDEIAADPNATKDKKAKKKTAPKPITSTALRRELLEASTLLLKAGLACQLKDGEECENTAIAVERVASDLIGLNAAVATALNRCLKSDDPEGGDPALIKRWCEFYSEELMPQTKAMVKKTTPKLDAFGLFLPSRMGTQLSPELLQKGLKLESEEESAPAEESPSAEAKESVEDEEEEDDKEEEEEKADEEEALDDEEANEYDQYEYEEEDYYDDEEDA